MTNDKQMKKDLYKQLGLQDLSEESKQEFLEKMNEIILKRVFLAVAEKLSQEDQKHLEGLVEKESEPKIVEDFLLKKIPNYKDMVQNIAKDFVQELKDEMKEEVK